MDYFIVDDYAEYDYLDCWLSLYGLIYYFMNKEWLVAPAITEEELKDNPGYSRVILQLLKNRNIIKKEDIDYFLNYDYKKGINDPFLFNKMEDVVNLIIKHIKAENKILIFGDYDADGVTSSALLFDLLKILRAKAEVYLPHRVKEGYGLSKEAVNWAKENKINLIITVDGGIRSKEEVALAKKLGMDVIITDHHLPPESPEDLPDCFIINPQVENEVYPEKKLAGVGVAFKLAQAIISKSKLSNKDKDLLEKKLLDLVAIGTVADIVSLQKENRILVKKGLEILNQTNRVGLQELINLIGIKDNKKLDTFNIGFQIAPRLNAAGRVDHANTAFKLLVIKDKKEAHQIAENLNQNNTERQRITEEIFNKVEAQIKDSKDNILIGVCDVSSEEEEEVWSEGVIGLVSGKLTEKYHKPSLVITKSENGYKGSGRSIEGLNLVESLEECSNYLEKYGGHAMAAGFSFSRENLNNFLEKIKNIANNKLTKKDLIPKINIDMEIKLEDINEKLIEELETLSPFGFDNPKPKFLSREVVIKDIMTMGIDGQHIKFRLNGFWALSFNGTENLKDFKIGDRIDIVYYVETNEFNGHEEIQLKIIDMKKNQISKIKNQN